MRNDSSRRARFGPWRLAVVGMLAWSAAAMTAVPARAQVSWTDYSVVTIGSGANGNLSTGSDITGNAFVSGSVTGAGFTIGQDLPTASGTQYSLSVVGSVSTSGVIDFDRGYGLLYGNSYNPSNITPNTAPVTENQGLLNSEQAMLSNQITTSSAYFSNLSANGTITPGSGTLQLTANGSGVAVFNLNLNNYNLNNLTMNLSIGSASTVVIDVTNLPSGAYSFPSSLHLGEDFDDANASKIIWNFGGATGTIETTTQWYGSLLAPDAQIQIDSDVDGSIYAQSFDGLSGEVHYLGGGHVLQYDGFNPAAVPEPSSMVMAAIGVVVVAYLGRRRRIRREAAR